MRESIAQYSSGYEWSHRLKVTPDLRGCPLGKNSYACHFKGKHGNMYISLESLIQ